MEDAAGEDVAVEDVVVDDVVVVAVVGCVVEYMKEYVEEVERVVVAPQSDHHGQMKVADSSARTACHGPDRKC